jgi:hypothetical protein
MLGSFGPTCAIAGDEKLSITVQSMPTAAALKKRCTLHGLMGLFIGENPF